MPFKPHQSSYLSRIVGVIAAAVVTAVQFSSVIALADLPPQAIAGRAASLNLAQAMPHTKLALAAHPAHMTATRQLQCNWPALHRASGLPLRSRTWLVTA